MSYRVAPTGHPVASVLFAHGFAEGARRHAPTLTYLAASGYAVFAYDMAGHGNSPGARGFVRRFDDVVRVSEAMRTRIDDRYPKVPLFLMGYSLGGLVAVRDAQRHPAGIAGVVLVGVGIGIASRVPPLVRRLGVALGEVAPYVPVARLRLRNLRPDDVHPPPSLLDAVLPRDPLIPARTAAEAMRASHAALADAHGWRTPTLVVHGDADRIVPLSAAQRFIDLAPHAESTLCVVPGGHHDLLRGRDGDAVRATIAAWIRARSIRTEVP